jgi:hypothetical protein
MITGFKFEVAATGTVWHVTHWAPAAHWPIMWAATVTMTLHRQITDKSRVSQRPLVEALQRYHAQACQCRQRGDPSRRGVPAATGGHWQSLRVGGLLGCLSLGLPANVTLSSLRPQSRSRPGHGVDQIIKF